MITASEAREIVGQGKYEKAGKQWNEIELAISDAIKIGKHSAVFGGIIDKVNK